ncbi:hypothetical protein B7P43_G08450 [Cryptotermes secundus]|nr:hypothetical protein B7P43_G08450 [Cryptotermes secundus]
MSNARQVPRNCKRAITKKGDQFYPDPNYRMYAGDGNTRARYLQVSMQNAISTAEDHLKGHHFQKGEVEKQLKVVQEQLQTNSNELRETGAVIEKLNKEDLSFMTKLTRLKDMEEPEPNSIATLTAELEEHTRKKDEICKERDALQAECQRLKHEVEKAEEKSLKIRDTSTAIQVKERPLRAKRESVQNELKEILSRKIFQEERLKELCQKIQQIETQLHKQQEVAKKAVEDGTKICPRIDTKRPPKIVERELNECKNYMESMEKHSGAFEEICVSYHEKKTKYEQIAEDIRLLEKELAHMEDMIRARKKTFYAIQKLSSVRVQHMFQSLLHQRNYTGKIMIDHSEQTLEIRVSPSEKREMAAETKSLSGGERSYATVSFIMALWDAIDPPFYFLDEFDVFMDKVNRRVILDLLLAHSQQKTNYQFVFLTPQDTSAIQSSADVRIHRMQDPCRSKSNTQ